MTFLHVILLAIVEGVTEYLPISSTGHIILTSSLLGIEAEQFTKDFTVIVQFGAIMAVVVLFFERLRKGEVPIKSLILSVLPAIILGPLVKNYVDDMLGSVQVVATTLILGGIAIIILEKILTKPSVTTLDKLTTRQSIMIGLFQCVAFIPGVSRAAATIIGGRIMGLDRLNSAEYSFLLAVPTLTAAAAFKSIKIIPTILPEQIQFIIVGNIVSFFVAYISIKLFIGFLKKYSMAAFGWYRIVIGLIFFIK
jgi:undecaprenyl-diphosphatase